MELCSKLADFGLLQSKHDHCLFTMTKGSYFLAMLVYVDDVSLTNFNPTVIHELNFFWIGNSL